MKKAIRLFFLLFLFTAALAIQSHAQTVYVTETGKKYHAKNCELAKTGKKGVTLEAAKKQGYTPCKNCKVEALPADTKKSSTDKPKKK